MAETTETPPAADEPSAASAPSDSIPLEANQGDASATAGGVASAPARSDDSPRASEAAAASGVAAPPQPAPVSDELIAERAAAEWRVIGETVPGASHLRAGTPNQDAILYVRQSSARLPLIVSISDGHGSDKCFRSHRGSRFAVRVGCDLLDELAGGKYAALPPSELVAAVREKLPAEFVRRWRAAVAADLKREPLREEEFMRMVERDGEESRRLVESNPFLAYGATSLSLLLTPAHALYLQLGDGEIITVSETGEVANPLPDDARLLANETTSLCLERAAEDFRFAVRPHGEGALPALILLTTDGYYNSFSTTAGFRQVGGDLIQMLREPGGFGAVNRGVKGWLEEATAAGSGDDCTLAIVCRMDAFTESAPAGTTPPSSSHTATSAANGTTSAAPTAAPAAPPQQDTPAQNASPQIAAQSAADQPDAPAASHGQPAAPKTD